MRHSIAASAAAALLTAALSLATAPPAAAEDFSGTWTYDLTQCKAAQDTPEAPMVVTRSGYDQHETHCAFKSIDGQGPDWTIKAECTVEGDAQAMDLKLTVSGDTLTITDEAGSRDLLRCK